MLPQIAQSTPPAGLDSWLASAFYLIGLATALIVLYQRLRPQPPRQTTIEGQPVVVRPDAEWAPLYAHRELSARVDGLAAEVREGFEKLDNKRSRDVAALHKDLGGGLDSLRLELKGDNAGVHTRITEVLASLSEVKGQLKQAAVKDSQDHPRRLQT